MENKNKHIDQLNGRYPEPDIPAEKAWSMMQIQLDAALPVNTGGFSAIVQKLVKSVLGRISIGLISAVIVGSVVLYIAKHSDNQKDGQDDKQETIHETREKTEGNNILNPNKSFSEESYLNKGKDNEESADKSQSSKVINKDLSRVNKNEHNIREVGKAGSGSDHNEKSVNKDQVSGSTEKDLAGVNSNGDNVVGKAASGSKQIEKPENRNKSSKNSDKDLSQVNRNYPNVKSTVKADYGSGRNGNVQNPELSADRYKRISEIDQDESKIQSIDTPNKIKDKSEGMDLIIDNGSQSEKLTVEPSIDNKIKINDYRATQNNFSKLPSITFKGEKPTTIVVSDKTYKTSKLKVDSSLLNKKKGRLSFLHAVDAGLQFNMPLAFNANGHYFTGSNGEKQAYKTFIPSVWVSKRWSRNEVLLNFVPFQQNFINNKSLENYTDQSDPTDSSTIVNHKTALFKTMGVGLGIQYNYELTPSLVIGAGLNYNQQSSAIIRQVDTRFIGNIVLKDSTFATKSGDYIKPYFIATKLELLYRQKRFDTGFNLQIPLTNQTAKPDINSRSINGQLFFRWRIWTK